MTNKTSFFRENLTFTYKESACIKVLHNFRLINALNIPLYICFIMIIIFSWLGYHLAITLAATSSALALVLVVTTVVFIVRKKILKKRRGTYVLYLDFEIFYVTY